MILLFVTFPNGRQIFWEDALPHLTPLRSITARFGCEKPHELTLSILRLFVSFCQPVFLFVFTIMLSEGSCSPSLCLIIT